MGQIKPDDIRDVVVVGHKGSGKTQLLEAMAYLVKATPRIGKPGDRTCGLDDTPEERGHLATLETRLISFGWRDKKLNFLDTPGDTAFWADTQLALAAADAAILVVSAKHGVETGTERVARWIRDHKLPCIVALSKLDVPDCRMDEVLTEVRSLKLPIALMQYAQGTGETFKGVVDLRARKAWLKAEGPGAYDATELPAELRDAVEKARGKLVDEIASSDDALTERYLTEGDLSAEELDQGARKGVAAERLAPVYLTSGLLPVGIAALMDALVELAPASSERPGWTGADEKGNEATRPPIADAPLAAAVVKTKIDPHAGRISLVRVISGVLHHDAHLWCQSSGQRERAAQLLQGTPKDMKPLPEAVAGELVYVTKLKSAATGETLSDEKHPFVAKLPAKPVSLYSRAVIVESKQAEDKVTQALQKLCEEDAGLGYSHAEGSRELLISGLGAQHLEIAIERLKHRTGQELKLGPPRIPYRETVARAVQHVEGKHKKQTGGHGQFGVCYIDVEPLPRGSGFEFEDAIVGGSVPRQFIPSVEKGINRALGQGAIAGYPIVDLRVRLVDGKYHSVDSSDAAFQMAGYKGFKAAMLLAHPILLEPVVKLEVHIPSEAMGDVIGDISSRGGKVLNTEQDGESTIITAQVPLAQTLEYEPALTGMTRGRGRFTSAFDHYEPCPPHVQEKVIKESGFKAQVEED
ncbi:MAG: elongation factor G [Myxococcales bacterium]|nr:elongation factor G [Myxococcales bacterium]